MSSNDAHVASGVGRPARWSVSFGNDHDVVSRPASVNLADAGAIPGTRLVVEPRLLLWTGSCGAGRADINRLTGYRSWWLALSRSHPVPQCRPSSVHRATTTPASEYTFHRNYVSVRAYSERERRAGGVGGEPTLSHPMVPIKDVNE